MDTVFDSVSAEFSTANSKSTESFLINDKILTSRHSTCSSKMNDSVCHCVETRKASAALPAYRSHSRSHQYCKSINKTHVHSAMYRHRDIKDTKNSTIHTNTQASCQDDKVCDEGTNLPRASRHVASLVELLPSDQCIPQYPPKKNVKNASSAASSWITPVPSPEERKREQLILARRQILKQQRAALQKQEERLGGILDDDPQEQNFSGEVEEGEKFKPEDFDLPRRIHRASSQGKQRGQGTGGGLTVYIKKGGKAAARKSSSYVDYEEEINQSDLLSVFKWSTSLASEVQFWEKDTSIQTVPRKQLEKTSTVLCGSSICPNEPQPPNFNATRTEGGVFRHQESDCTTLNSNPISKVSTIGGIPQAVSDAARNTQYTHCSKTRSLSNISILSDTPAGHGILPGHDVISHPLALAGLDQQG